LGFDRIASAILVSLVIITVPPRIIFFESKI